VLKKPSDFDVETAKEADIDHVVVIVRTWRWQIKVVDPVALRTSPIGKPSKLLNQIGRHQTQPKRKLVPTKKIASIDGVPTTSKTLSKEKTPEDR